MKQFEDMTEEEFDELVDIVAKKLGASITNSISGSGCDIYWFAHLATEVGGQALVLAATEALRLLGGVLVLVANSDYDIVIEDPSGDGHITGFYVDPETVGGLSDDEVTIESLAQFIQGGVNLLPNGANAVVAYCIDAGPDMCIEFIHAMIHGVAALLEMCTTLDTSKLSRFGLDDFGKKASAAWN